MAKKQNPWLLHVNKVKKANPTLKLKDVLLKAKETYKKDMKGGAMYIPPTGIAPVMKIRRPPNKSTILKFD